MEIIGVQVQRELLYSVFQNGFQVKLGICQCSKTVYGAYRSSQQNLTEQNRTSTVTTSF